MSSFRSWRPVVAAVFLVACTGCKPTGERALIEGDKLLSANRPEEAIPLLERAVEGLPQNASALNRLGMAYQSTGRLEDARKQYLRALKFDQNLFEAQHNLGFLYFDTANWIEAERCLRIWLGQHPNDIDALYRLGLAQYRNGAPTEAAEQSLATVARANAADAEVWNTLGLISTKRRKYKEAQQRFNEGLKMSPDHPGLHLNLAILLQQYLNDRKGAVLHYRAFIDANPDGPEAPSVRALLLQLDPPPTPPAPTESTNRNIRASLSVPAPVTNAPATPTIRPPPTTGTGGDTVSSRAPNTATERRSTAANSPVQRPVPPATSAPPSSATLAPAKPLVTNEARTASTPNSAKPSSPTNSTAATPTNAIREVVRVSEDPVPAPAVDRTNPIISPTAKSVTATSDSLPTLVATGTPSIPTNLVATLHKPEYADGADPAPGDKSKSKSFWNKVNPVRWFQGDPATPAMQPRPTPLNPPPLVLATTTNTTETAPKPQPVIYAGVPKKPAAPPPKPVFPRYRRQVLTAPTPGDRSTAEQENNRGVDAYNQKNLADAMASYRQAILADRSYFDAYFNLSLAALESGDASEALLASENAVQLQPSNDDARQNFATALQRGGFPVDAAVEYEKLSAHRPKDVPLHLTLASLYARELIEPDKARPHYEKVIDLNPQHPKADAIRAWLAGTR
ncbi:MAG TPA: tetratricopeptide repeat protein [Candidatus Limnocylindria bacterium]|nr:tetratricopeptide repeat protein [Candidatus Limnocylindria bacterium]